MTTDRYSAYRAQTDAPALLTATHKAIMALWAALRYDVYAERTCLRAYRQADGRPIGFLAQLSEADGQKLRAYLQGKLDADRALAAKDAYAAAYEALCDAEEAEAPAYSAYLSARINTPEHDAAFAVWWPLREAREAAYEALHALPVPPEVQP